MPAYAPGLLHPLRFISSSDCHGQSGTRDYLRELWHRCYFGKDFEGAAMVIIAHETCVVQITNGDL
jgi:hypothetical protein